MLTDAAVKNSKQGNKLQKLSDSGGLQLWLTPNGSKLWRVAFRFNGKQKLLSLGKYPEIGLLCARKFRDLTKQQLQLSGLISKRPKAKRILQFTKKNGCLEWRWKFFANAPFLKFLRTRFYLFLSGSRSWASTKRLRSVLGSAFRYAFATARASNDPTTALRGALITPKVKHRAELTTETDAGTLLRVTLPQTSFQF